MLEVPPGHEILVTTDFSLEDMHFRRRWHPARSVGHRCLTRGLSDIASMGGEPLAVFLSLALPADLPQRWVDEFVNGLLALAKKFSVPLAGGDTAQSPSGVLADIMVTGSVPKGKAVLRSTAKPGDLIYVTGALGESASVLGQLFAGKKVTPTRGSRHFYPAPRLDVGQELRATRLASAMIDISDGLSTDLQHICEESGVGAVVHESEIPVAHGASLAEALNGGDDYELLFTSRKRVPEKIAGVAIHQIGEIINRRGMWIQDGKGRTRPLKARGWEHFR